MDRTLASAVPGPMAWKGAELAASGSWVYHLPDTALEDIDVALAAVCLRGLSVHEIGKADFPLPSIAPGLKVLLQEIEKGRGFVLIRGVPVGRYAVDELEKIFWGIGTHFGTALAQNSSGERLLHVTDRGDQYGATNVRGYTTRSGQQLHTDSATDIVVLFCVRKAKSGGVSQISSSMAVYNEFLARYPPEYLDQLYKGFHYDRRGEERPGVPSITERPVPVFSYHAGRLSCYYSHITILQAARKSGRSLTELEASVLDAFDEIAAREAMRLDMALQPGDVQLLNNRTVLHARTGWEDHDDPQRKRLMLRLWLEPADPWPLAADAWNVDGRGDRRGVPPKEAAGL
ncbi:MAG: hypothetical protein A3I02_06675 [Betaproteobacteria bacterium RIFCSPLOWO2_02_FULL_67_26]|nr:MAG: hypothetical protein A3I02_06675 [Betaproteobacteria bacterium RIFCSPLOWO2_02_FULL_67_26]